MPPGSSSGCLCPGDLFGLLHARWPSWGKAKHLLSKDKLIIGIYRPFPESTVAASSVRTASSQCFLLPNSQDPKTVPSFSFFLSLSQMAILLTAARKMLHSTAHSSPGMFVKLFELQPPLPPSLKMYSFKVD